MKTGNYILSIIYFICTFAYMSNAAEYHCYKWTAEDQREMGTKPSVSAEKAQCKKHFHMFTNGDNGKYIGCGTCKCCIEVVTVTTLGNGTSKLLNMWCSLLKKFGEMKSLKSQC